MNYLDTKTTLAQITNRDHDPLIVKNTYYYNTTCLEAILH